jgi:hypothetical protein
LRAQIASEFVTYVGIHHRTTIFGKQEESIHMAASDRPTLSEDHLVELERLGRAQGRTVNEVLAEAVDDYLKEKQWSPRKGNGRARVKELCLTEDDVQPASAIESSRRSA